MKAVLDFFIENYISFSLSAGIILAYVISRTVVSKLITTHSFRNEIAYERGLYIRKLSNAFLFMIFATVLGAAWEISIQGLSFYFASIFTVIGVALFATWSILSNLTASILLFFFFPYRIGSTVKIIDGDNSIEGKIVDITFFYLKVETNEGSTVVYPNSLAVQKPVLQS